MDRKRTVPRGIRNCNPLNIRIGNTWLGEREDPDETEYEQFVSTVYGIRAAFLILRRYIRRFHLNTIRLIVSCWSQSKRFSIDSYISMVSSMMNLDPDTPIAYEDWNTMCKLVDAMITVECGQPVDKLTIGKAYRMT